MKRFLKEWGLFTLIITLGILSRIFIWSIVTVGGHSMDPTLYDKDQLVMLKVGDVKRFDIVVANEIDENGEDKLIIKRVIGMPGDTIHYENDTLYVNGQEVAEPYLDEYEAAFAQDKLQDTYSYNVYFQERALEAQSFTEDSQHNANFTVEVPEGQYYLLGDNRLISQDSRTAGTFSEADIKGKILFRLWPINRLQSF